MFTHPTKRIPAFQLDESESHKKQKNIPSHIDTSVYDNSRDKTIIGDNITFNYGSSFTWNMHNTVDSLIQDLTRSHNAEYDMKIASAARGPCTPDTRIAVLQELLDWCNSDSAVLHWLGGMAGTGKTTIAYTVCQKLAQSEQLGASFFCSRSLPDCRDVKLIIPTIAFQLAHRFTPFSEALTSALRSDEYILKRDLDVQLRKLIIEPWTASKEHLPSNTVIVLEALDECDEDYSEFLQVIVDHVTTLPFKILMTSRPEPAIRETMMKKAQATGSLSAFILHEVEKDLVREDIVKYLTSELFPRVGPDDICFLAELAGTSFVFAATLVRFLTARHADISIRIQLLRTSLPMDAKLKMLSPLDELYKEVLRAVFHSDLMEMEVQQIRAILFTVICAREPLTRRAIANLWNLEEQDVERRLDPLRSVIFIPDDNDQPIIVFHASFSDFMEDPTRSEQFCCQPQVTNLQLVQQCLGLMKHELRQNPCRLNERPPNNTVHPDVIDQHISPGLQYATVYWLQHWAFSDHLERRMVLSPIQDFLTTHLLHWVEVLSLLHQLPVNIQSLEKLQDTVNENSILTSLVHHSLRFIQYADPIEYCAIETYFSALTWIPLQSPLRAHYSSLCERVPRVLCGLPATWQGLERTISVHSGVVWSIAISRDGRYVISGSHDKTVRIWNVHSHMQEYAFSAHSKKVTSVAISGDGSYAVSGSNDATVRAWNITNCEAIVTIESDSPVLAVAMSPNNRWIASGHENNLIRLWDAVDGHLIRSLRGHEDSTKSLSFVPDSTRLFSGSSDQTTRIWSVATGTMERVLLGHRGGVWSVASSPSGDQIITGSDDWTARLWDISGKNLQAFSLHTAPVWCVAFMPDGDQVITSSADRTLRIWDIASGHMVHVFTGPASVLSFAVFPHGLKIASSSGKTISIWSLMSGNTIDGKEEKEGTPPPIVEAESVAFSRTGRTILLLPSLRVLDTATLEEKVVLGPDGVEYSHTALSTSGSRVAASYGSWTQLYMIKVWELTNNDTVANSSILQGHTWDIKSVSFSHDDFQLVSASKDKTVRIWDVASGNQIRVLNHFKPVHSAAFSPDDTQIVSATFGIVHVWNTQSGMQLRQFNADAYSVAFSPDSRHMIISYGVTINIYGTGTFRLEHTYKGYKYWTIMNDGSSYALSQDGQWIYHSPRFGDQPRRLLWIPSQYRPHISRYDAFNIDGPLFTPTSTGVQVCLPRTDGLVTLVIPRDALNFGSLPHSTHSSLS